LAKRKAAAALFDDSDEEFVAQLKKVTDKRAMMITSPFV
jgi:hypothetical protein